MSLPRSKRHKLLEPETVFKEWVLRDCRDKIAKRLAQEPTWSLESITYSLLLTQMELEVRAWKPGEPRFIANTDGVGTLEAERGAFQHMKDKVLGAKNRNERVWGWINEKQELICKDYTKRDIFAFDLQPHVKYLVQYVENLIFARTNGSGHTCHEIVHKRCFCEVDFEYVLETCDPNYPKPYWPRTFDEAYEFYLKTKLRIRERPAYFDAEDWKPELHLKQLQAMFESNQKATLKVVTIGDLVISQLGCKNDPNLFIQELGACIRVLERATNQVKIGNSNKMLQQ